MAQDTDQASSGHAKNELLNGRVQLANSVVALITALIGLLVLIAGLTIHSASQANDKADTTEQRAQALTEQNQQLTEQNQQLQEQIQSMQADSGGDAGTPGPAAGPTTPAEPQIWHEGDVTITTNSGADLDAASDDQSWGQIANAGNPFTNGGPFDIWYRGGSIVIDPLKRSGAAAVAPASFANCQTSGYSRGTSLSLEQIQHGKEPVLCLTTDDGRYSAVTLVEASSNEVTVHVITWKADGDA